MLTRFSAFLRSEDAAVTVDWVVLTAAMTGLGFAVAAPIISTTTSKSTGIGAAIEATPVADNTNS